MTSRLTRLRRPLASLFAAAAAGLALLALRPGPPPSVRVPAAARDLPAGKTLTASDLHHIDLPPSAVPSGALRSSPVGRVLAAPMRKNEPLTDARVVSAALLKGYGPGTVATPVRVADAAAARLLRPGDRIDVLSRTSPPSPDFPPAAEPARRPPANEPYSSTRTIRPVTVPPPTAQPEARVVVSGVPVVAVPRAEGDSGQEGALIVLATDRAQALALAAAAPPLSVTITGRWAYPP
ncbi:SAF domain-containing protein [Actinomadura sp.]|uniref:SAF domain-containing protein n=1 Tax=Actinomadura sp. TaxID=1989 RepID=UPI0037C8608C